MQDWYDGASPKNDGATKVRSVVDISPRKTFVGQHGCSNLSHKLDKAPRLSICIYRLSWTNTVSEAKIQITLLILRQGALSSL